MYLKMTSGFMPCGRPIKYVVKADGLLYPKPAGGTSLIAKECLDYLKKEYFPDLQTAYDSGMFHFYGYVFLASTCFQWNLFIMKSIFR